MARKFHVVRDPFASSEKPYAIMAHNPNGNNNTFLEMSKQDLADVAKEIVEILAKE